VTVSVSNTLANSTTTVAHFRARVNELATAMTGKVVTTDSNSAVGNAAITGTFEALTLVSNSVGGGNTSVSNTLYVTTTTQFQGNADFTRHVNLGIGANVHVLIGNSTHRVVAVINAGANGLTAIRPALSDLDDFSVTGPTHGQVLAYSNVSGKFENLTTVQSANDAALLGGQPNSFYTNATNMATGTIPVARVNGAYTSINAVGALANLTVTGNTSVGGRLGIGQTAPAVSLHITANDAVQVPVGNTGQRPTGADGMFRYNQESAAFEGYIGGSWGNVSSFVGGTLTAKLTLPASNSTVAFFNLPHGSAPSGAVNGDFWTTTSGSFVRVGGSNKSHAFLEGGTFSGNVTFSANVTTQNVSGNYYTLTTANVGTFVSGNSTVNVTANSTALKFSNSTATGTIDIDDASKEYLLFTFGGRTDFFIWPATIAAHWPIDGSITKVWAQTDSGTVSNFHLKIDGVSVNNVAAKTVTTTINSWTVSSNNVLVPGSQISANVIGAVWGLAITVEITKS
jgi:hypothetical protein